MGPISELAVLHDQVHLAQHDLLLALCNLRHEQIDKDIEQDQDEDKPEDREQGEPFAESHSSGSFIIYLRRGPYE